MPQQTNRARFERHARGWSRSFAAQRAKIDPRDVEDIETNRRPDQKALRALALVYGFSADIAHVLLNDVPPSLQVAEPGPTPRTEGEGENGIPSPPSLRDAIVRSRS